MTKSPVSPHRSALLAFGLLSLALVGQISVVAKDKDKELPRDEKRDTPLTLQVTPRYALAGASVQALIRVSPDASNRLLRITVDSLEYFRSSEVALDGSDAARTHIVPLKALPAGSYAVLAVVYGAKGERARSEQKFELFAAQDPDRPLTRRR